MTFSRGSFVFLVLVRGLSIWRKGLLRPSGLVITKYVHNVAYAPWNHFEVRCLTTWRQGSSSSCRLPRENLVKSVLSSGKEVPSSQSSGVTTKTPKKQPGINSLTPMASGSLTWLLRMWSLLERVSAEVDRLVDDPEGDFQLLGSSEGHKDVLDGDCDGADPSYFDQGYLSPQLGSCLVVSRFLFFPSGVLILAYILVNTKMDLDLLCLAVIHLNLTWLMAN